jgi:transmembrane sensor
MEEKYLLSEWLNDERSVEEVPEFADKNAFETYNKIKKYSSQLETSDFNEDKMLAEILQIKKQKETKVVALKQHWIFRIAAALVLGFGMFFIYQNFSVEKQIASNGTKTNFTLPDNSEVVLNSGSEIQYKKSNWNRKLNLTGEAFFKVAKGKRFEVTTSLGKVAVLGTQFGVKARENRFDVTCYEGRVQVNYNKKQVLLTAGQSVTFENDKQTTATIINKNPDWMQNKIAFDKENLQQVIDELERVFAIEINPNLFDTSGLFTGKVPSNDLDVALDIIATTYRLKVIKSNEKSIIFEKK